MEKIQGKLNTILLPIVAALAILTYIAFTNFKPQAYETPQVQGLADKNTLIPILQNAELLSENSTGSTRTITLQTAATPEKVMRFYKNALYRRSWELDAEGNENSDYNARYKKDGNYINIATTIQIAEQLDAEVTIVTLEISTN